MVDIDCFDYMEITQYVKNAADAALMDIAYNKCGFKSAYKKSRKELEIIVWMYYAYEYGDKFDLFTIEEVILNKCSLHKLIAWVLKHANIDMQEGVLWCKGTREELFVDPY